MRFASIGDGLSCQKFAYGFALTVRRAGVCGGLLALCLILSVTASCTEAWADGAPNAASQASPLQIVSIIPISKTLLPAAEHHTPKGALASYRYVYSVSVKNTGGTVQGVVATASTLRRSVSLEHAVIPFSSIATGATADGMATFSFTANTYFDRRLDAYTVNAAGEKELPDAGADPEDPLPEAIQRGHKLILDSRLDAYFSQKLSRVFVWTFGHPSTGKAPFITQTLPIGYSSNTQPEISADIADDIAAVKIASVTILVDGINVTHQATISAAHLSFKVPVAQALQQGLHQVRVTVADEAGNVSVNHWVFNVDSIPPVIASMSPAAGSTTPEQPLVAATFADKGSNASDINVAKIQLSVDGVDVTSQAIIGPRQLSYTPAHPLGNGLHTAHIQISDMAGNTAASDTSFTVDGTALTSSTLLPPTVRSAAPLAAGTASAPARVDTPVAAAVADRAATKVAVPAPVLQIADIIPVSKSPVGLPGRSKTPGVLPEYLYVYRVAVKNTGGATQGVVGTASSERPSVTIVSGVINFGSVASESTVTGSSEFSFVANKFFDRRLDAVTVNAKGGSVFAEPGTDPDDGTGVQARVSTKNPAGSVIDAFYSKKLASVFTWKISSNQNQKALLISNRLPGPYATTLRPNISADIQDYLSAVSVSTIKVMVDAANVTRQSTIVAGHVSYTPPTSAPLAQGAHSVQITADDASATSESGKWRFVVDTEPPIIGSYGPLPGGYAPLPVVINAQFRDAGTEGVGSGINVSAIKLNLDGTDVTKSAKVLPSQISYAMPAGTVGNHIVTLVVPDNAGNTTTKTWQFSADLVPPTIALQNNVDGATFSADWLPAFALAFSDADSGVDPKSLKVALDGIDITSSLLAAGNTPGAIASGEVLHNIIYSYSQSKPLFEGTHKLVVTVKDYLGNIASAQFSFTTKTPPVISNPAPSATILSSGAEPVISASYSDIGSGIAIASVKMTVDGYDVTKFASITLTSIRYTPTTPLFDGAHTVELTVLDNVGNPTELTWTFFSGSGPIISAMTPSNTLLPFGSTPTISAQIAPTTHPVDATSVHLILNGNDVTSAATVSETSVSYTPPAPLPTGDYSLYLQVSDNTNNSSSVAWEFSVGSQTLYSVAISQPQAGYVTDQPAVSFSTTVTINNVAPVSVLVNGQSLPLVDQPPSGDMTQEINVYTGTVSLSNIGINTLQLVITFSDGHVEHRSVTVTYDPPPSVTILSPADLALLGAVNPNSPRDLTGAVERPVTISGSLTGSVVSVTINQQQASITGNTFQFNNFFLHEGHNVLTAVATDSQGRSGSSTISVDVDQTAPILTVETPLDSSVTSNTTIDVRGSVNDAVAGEVVSTYPSVTVSNLTNGAIVTANVSDIYYFAQAIPLAIGANALQITATDAAGNSRLQTITVSRITVGSSRLTPLGGDHQIGALNIQLPQPLEVIALDNQGNPLANTPINFDVTRGTGALAIQATSSSQAPALTRNAVVTTDASGSAKVWLTLGRQSGVGGNVVRAYSPLFKEEYDFTATGNKGLPTFIRADGGLNQIGVVNSPAMETLSAVVFDAEENRIQNVPIVFKITEGDALFSNGTSKISVSSDTQGRAIARVTLGATTGMVTISAEVDAADGSALLTSSSYVITVLGASTGATALAGKVLDNVGRPLAGVTLSIARTSLSATSDSTGFFHFDSGVPVGTVDLFIDGRTVDVKSGAYPALHFQETMVPGIVNALPHPIYLPPLLTSNAKVVGGNQDVTITLPGFSGFSMTVKANSVTFPDGSHTGPLIVSPVQLDKLPMVPPGGYAGFTAPAWTIQPAGTRFDPPIQVTIPNGLGLKPGDTRDIFQWDHDLSEFVPIGRATVSEDGSQLISDAGSGVSKAGWGGAPAPAPNINKPNYCANSQVCNACSMANPGSGPPCCVFDPSKNNKTYGIDILGAKIDIDVDSAKLSNSWLDKLLSMSGQEVTWKATGSIAGKKTHICCAQNRILQYCSTNFTSGLSSQVSVAGWYPGLSQNVGPLGAGLYVTGQLSAGFNLDATLQGCSGLWGGGFSFVASPGITVAIAIKTKTPSKTSASLSFISAGVAGKITVKANSPDPQSFCGWQFSVSGTINITALSSVQIGSIKATYVYFTVDVAKNNPSPLTLGPQCLPVPQIKGIGNICEP